MIKNCDTVNCPIHRPDGTQWAQCQSGGHLLKVVDPDGWCPVHRSQLNPLSCRHPSDRDAAELERLRAIEVAAREMLTAHAAMLVVLKQPAMVAVLFDAASELQQEKLRVLGVAVSA